MITARAQVTIVIPTLSIRGAKLSRAVGSVLQQTHPVASVAVAVDHDHDGAWSTRNRAVAMAQTEWVGFLDDDDELLPFHVESLLALAAREQADMVWGWFHVITVRGPTPEADPFPMHRGRQYDPNDPHIIPITYLVKRELLQAAVANMGGFKPDEIGAWDNQDMPVIQEMCRLGGKLAATATHTWLWHHWGYGTPGNPGNTSGLPGRW